MRVSSFAHRRSGVASDGRGIALSIQRMAISGDIAVGAVVGVLLHLIGAVALDGDNSGVGHLDHNAGVADLPTGLEEYLIADLRVAVIPPSLLVVLC